MGGENSGYTARVKETFVNLVAYQKETPEPLDSMKFFTPGDVKAFITVSAVIQKHTC